MSYTAILITVLIVYLLFNLIVGLWASNRQAKADEAAGKGFINNYFIGGRSMGGLVLAILSEVRALPTKRDWCGFIFP